MKYAVKKSFLLISLMLVGSCQAQPVQEQHSRQQRQLKSATAAAEADVKMLAASAAAATMTPATTAMQMPIAGLPINQMSIQMGRYAGYPGLMFGGGSAPASPFLGVAGIANNYPSDPSLGLGYGLGSVYPGNPQAAGFMYGNAMYPNAQFGAGNVGFGAQPGVDHFTALNNIINVANMQGLGAAVPPTGLYPQAGVAGLSGVAGLGGLPGFLGGINDATSSSILERMHHYTPTF